jgi:hypothetical protein
MPRRKDARQLKISPPALPPQTAKPGALIASDARLLPVQDEPRFPRPGRRSSVVINEQYSDRQLRALCVQQFEVSTFSTRGPLELIP